MWTGRTTQAKEPSEQMTANQRRPGFRLPWSSETDAAADGAPATAADASTTAPTEPAPTDAAEAPAAASTTQTGASDVSAPTEDVSAGKEAATPSSEGAEEKAATAESSAADVAAATPEATPTVAEAPQADTHPAEATVQAGTSGGDEFMRDLVAAMRRVADEARETSIADLKARADDQVRKLEADAERRREELRARAEADVAGVGEWAKAEAERIKAEAEQRVAARRAQLEQQLAGDQARTESDTKALRDRVAEYERELEAYHAQLGEIADPAAFAAAAKRMPQPPALVGGTPATPTAPATAPAAPAAVAEAPVEPAAGGSNGVAAAPAKVHPAEEEVLAARLAELDAALPEKSSAAGAAASEPATTEVVVKGLGSFGAITGFRQALAGVDGIDGVALSLGQTGEFVFRATHPAGFDVRGAITSLEGDGATIEDRPEGGLQVTLQRAR